MRESPLFVKTYDLLVYLMPVSEKFPRSQRPVLGRRLQTIALNFLDLLLAARKCTAQKRPALLHQADLELDRLRYTVRLCREIVKLRYALPCRWPVRPMILEANSELSRMRL